MQNVTFDHHKGNSNWGVQSISRLGKDITKKVTNLLGVKDVFSFYSACKSTRAYVLDHVDHGINTMRDFTEQLSKLVDLSKNMVLKELNDKLKKREEGLPLKEQVQGDKEKIKCIDNVPTDLVQMLMELDAEEWEKVLSHFDEYHMIGKKIVLCADIKRDYIPEVMRISGSLDEETNWNEEILQKTANEFIFLEKPLAAATVIASMKNMKKKEELSFQIFQQWEKKLDKENLLFIACELGDEERVKELIGSKDIDGLPIVDINKLHDGFGETLLMRAAKHGHLAIVKLLVQLGADVNKQTNLGKTALSTAVEETNRSCIIRFLIESGASIDLQNSQGQTALMRSIIRNRMHNFLILLLSGASIVKADGEGSDALQYAEIFEREVMMFLLQRKMQQNMQNMPLIKRRSV